MTVRDSENGNSLRLDYNNDGPCIDWRISGGQPGNIVFRVLTGPVPSLTMAFDSVPMQVRDVVHELMFRVVNG